MFETDALVFKCLEITVSFFRLTKNFRRTALLSRKLYLFDLFTDIPLARKKSRGSCFLPLAETGKLLTARTEAWQEGTFYPKIRIALQELAKDAQKPIWLYVSKLAIVLILANIPLHV